MFISFNWIYIYCMHIVVNIISALTIKICFPFKHCTFLFITSKIFVRGDGRMEIVEPLTRIQLGSIGVIEHEMKINLK